MSKEQQIEPPNPLSGTMAEQFLLVVASIWSEHPHYSIRQTLGALNERFPAARAQEPATLSAADVFVVKVDDPTNLINALRTLADRLEQGSMQYHSGGMMLVSRSIIEADKPMIEAVEIRSDLVVTQG